MIKPILTEQKSNCNMLVFGMKGFGKTSLVRGIIHELDRVIMLDTLQYEYTEENDGKIVTTYEDLVRELTAAEKDKGHFRLVARIPKDTRWFGLLEGMEKTTFVVEEMDTYADLYNLPDAIRDFYAYGRHRQNNLIAVTRNAQEIHPKIRKGTDVIISLYQDEPNVLDYLRKINRPVTDQLSKLKKGEWRILKGKRYLEEFLSAQLGKKVVIDIQTTDGLEELRQQENNDDN